MIWNQILIGSFTRDVAVEVVRAGSRGGPIESLQDMTGAFQREDDRFMEEKIFPLPFFEGGAVWGGEIPNSGILENETTGIQKYKVRKGDTFTSLATKFHIDVASIRAANPSLQKSLRVGSELVILPVSGILYDVREGDSLEGILAQFRIEKNQLVRYNPDFQKIIIDGKGTLILPNVAPGVVSSNTFRRISLPDLKDYFALPARGWNWGELHDENAVDIANKCGSPVYAAAEGLAIPDSELGDGGAGWNNGYGIFVLLEHPNKTKTRYAHLAKALVRPGDYVSRGDELGLMGNTGNTHGPTGCHLHFEVLGAKNSFAVR